MKIINPTDLSLLETIADCQIKMALETENFELDKEKITAGAKEVITNPSRGKYFLAFSDDDKFMGMLLTIPEWSDWRCSEVMWIHSVYILPEFRGQGIYKGLYNYLKDLVSSSDDYAGLRLYVDRTNLNAIEVYNKLGMNDQHYSLFEWLK
jgi:GNAT superfamily N-acetyltransferase